jgi:hypothetical protein
MLSTKIILQNTNFVQQEDLMKNVSSETLINIIKNRLNNVELYFALSNNIYVDNITFNHALIYSDSIVLFEHESELDEYDNHDDSVPIKLKSIGRVNDLPFSRAFIRLSNLIGINTIYHYKDKKLIKLGT